MWDAQTRIGMKTTVRSLCLILFVLKLMLILLFVDRDLESLEGFVYI